MLVIFGMIYHPESEENGFYWKGRALLRGTVGHI